METKLIIVEGLPGFGKTTTANLIYDILTENNINVELFLEGDLDHPADYDGVSCFNKNEFEGLLSRSGVFKEVFIDRVIKRENNYLLPYRKIKNEYGSKLSDQLLNTISKNDIYELSLEQNIELITDKWTGFAEKALKDNKTFIFECCFIQNPLTHGMVKYGEHKEKVINYIIRLGKVIESLNPVLFYVEQDDLEFSFKKAFKERPKEWSSFFIEYYTKQGYGKQHDYKGLEGTVKVLEARRDIEREIFDMLKMKKEKINNSQYETDKYKSMIIEKLNLFDVL
jgi:hypothetical protein